MFIRTWTNYYYNLLTIYVVLQNWFTTATAGIATLIWASALPGRHTWASPYFSPLYHTTLHTPLLYPTKTHSRTQYS